MFFSLARSSQLFALAFPQLFALAFPLFLLLDISHIISSLLVINELRQDNFIR